MGTEATTLKVNHAAAQHNAVQQAGEYVLRYGLVLVLAWIGAMKFTLYEAKGIAPLVSSSPLMSWLYHVLSLRAASNLIGVTEITTAVLIALRPVSARLAVVGSALGVLTFLTTLTFIFSLPGWEHSLGGFPALSGSGGFLLKDAVLLGASVWSLGEALAAVRKETTAHDARTTN
jgi:uncharacterized membrane protein YkgB